MKKIALLLLVCMATLAAPKAHAGLLISNKMGVKGGLTFYTANIKNAIPLLPKSNISYNTGFHVGIADRLTLLKLLYVQPELLYNRTSYDLKLDNGTTRVHTDLVNFPVAVGLHLLGFRVYAGPVVNILSNSGFSGSAFKKVTTTYPAIGYQGGVGFSILWVDVDFKINGGGAPTQTFINNDNSTSRVDLAKYNLMLSVGVMF